MMRGSRKGEMRRRKASAPPADSPSVSSDATARTGIGRAPHPHFAPPAGDGEACAAQAPRQLSVMDRGSVHRHRLAHPGVDAALVLLGAVLVEVVPHGLAGVYDRGVE